mmetsp:Transcript_16078/g.32414  ORF Transcript_16078/g.32414 Transcript_16078/m.32414 type:complete len:85 (+) Transcript_16078:2684-2938(+)
MDRSLSALTLSSGISLWMERNYRTAIPDELVRYYLRQSGFESDDVRVERKNWTFLYLLWMGMKFAHKGEENKMGFPFSASASCL